MTNLRKFLTAIYVLMTPCICYDAGAYFDRNERKPLEISNGCAYYDMDSGHFTWGKRPEVIAKTPDPTEDPDLPGIHLGPKPIMPHKLHHGRGI